MWSHAKTLMMSRSTRAATLQPAQLTQHGVPGLQIGAHAVATVKRWESKFHRSQGQEHAFQKPMGVKIVLFLKTKLESIISSCTEKNRTALNFRVVLGLQYWDLGVNGLPVLKPVIRRVSHSPKVKGGGPAMKCSSLQMKP